MIDEEAREEMLTQGVRSTPAVRVGDAWVVGFDKSKLDRLLGLE
jgi:hypothetical protein